MGTTFLDENGNYYVATDDIATPSGHTAVPARPNDYDTWNGSAWVTGTPPEPSTADIKAEAQRRIVAIVPEWKQRNLTAQASILAEKGRANWTADELAAWTAGAAIWAQVLTIRTKSNEIEAMDPRPHDYTSDEYWT